MPWEIALRVVSLPATDSSRKKRLKSMSDSDSPSTSALSSAEMMSSAGVVRRSSASCWAYMNISTWAWKISSSLTWYSGSSDPIIRLLHSKSLWRSSLGTPMSSAITSSGSSAATSTTKSPSPLASARSRIWFVELADVGLELTDHPRREAHGSRACGTGCGPAGPSAA